ncbi:MAG: sugar ABC transporter ATP-binding protein [Caulobacterales bacterium]|nr:sugar ABC transporter ATP-binding protein [Caulobacterales bacterium]
MPEPLVSMRGIAKAFGPVRVLEGVDFTVLPGEVHILAGENGAGKSTLVKILAGIHRQDAGSLEIAGRPAAPRTPLEAAALGIAVIHQELSLIPSLSVVDNLFLGRELARAGWLDRRAQRAQAAASLARLGLELDLEREVGDLPLATQQLVEIAKALALEARVIVMDEPTATLNRPEVERLFSLIAQLKADGCGIVYISHKMEEIYRLADRITVLRDGGLAGSAPAAEMPEPELVRLLVGRTLDGQFPPRTAIPGEVRLEVRGLRVPDPAGVRAASVCDVSFTARRGEILGFGGLQGSGASELFHGLTGSYGWLPAGSATLDGVPLRIASPRAAIAQGLALLTNDRKGTGLVLGLGIAANTTLATLPACSPGGWMLGARELAACERQRAALATRMAGPHQEVRELSGGNQQKVVLGKWLETRPRLLLLDEPTRGVDVGAKREIYALLDRLAAQGTTILLITSELPELLALSDRILVLHRGAIAGEFSRAEATQERIVSAAMGGKAA